MNTVAAGTSTSLLKYDARSRGIRVARRWPRGPCVRALMLAAVAWFFAGCVKAPSTVYLVDQKTVLEHQAGGELRALENDLNASALQPGPEPLTPAQLEAAGVAGGGLSPVAQLYAAEHGDADRIDALLIRRCLGEARTGLLEVTPDTCTGSVDTGELTRLVQRENRNRRQIWAYIQRQTPGAGETDIRDVWRKNHLLRVVCGGQIQADDGTWMVKQCGPGQPRDEPPLENVAHGEGGASP